MSYLYMVVQVVVSLVYVPLLLGTIGVNEYGLYQLVGSVMAYLLIMNSTIAAAVQRYYNKYLAIHDEHNAENVLGVAQVLYWGLSAATAIVGVVVIVIVNQVYDNSLSPEELRELSSMLVLLIFNVMIVLSNSIYNATIEAHERFFFHNLLMMVTVIVQLGVVAFAVQMWPCALTVAAIQLAFAAIDAVARHEYAKRRLGIRVRLHVFDKELAAALLVFSGGILLATVADQIFWRTDQLILGYFFGTESVAVYSIGSQIFMAYLPLGIAVSSVFLPKATRIYHGEDTSETLSGLFIRIGRISFLILAAVLTAFAIFGRDFIALWAGEGFEEAYLVAIIVMVPFTIDLIQNIGLTILRVNNTYGFRARIYFGVAVANIALTIIMVQAFGIIGAAVSTAIAMFVGNGLIMNWFYWKRTKLDIPRFWHEICRLALPLFVLFAIMFLLAAAVLPPASNWGIMALYLVGYAIVYLCVGWLFAFDDYERYLVSSVLKGAVRFIRSGGKNLE